MRKLASIKQIRKIEPIEGKDRIVLAHIDGWQAIVKKDEFQVGNLVIFCEPDSVLPQKHLLQIRRGCNKSTRNYSIRKDNG